MCLDQLSLGWEEPTGSLSKAGHCLVPQWDGGSVGAIYKNYTLKWLNSLIGSSNCIKHNIMKNFKRRDAWGPGLATSCSPAEAPGLPAPQRTTGFSCPLSQEPTACRKPPCWLVPPHLKVGLSLGCGGPHWPVAVQPAWVDIST